MSKHTPGPWESKDFKHLPRVSQVKGDGKTIADIYADENASANACLIAAAPELLEALQEICNHVVANDRGGYDIAPSYIRSARAAIAKATGGES